MKSHDLFYYARITILTCLLLGAMSVAYANHDTIEVLKGTQPVAKGVCLIGNLGLPCTKGANPNDPSYFLIIIEDAEGNALEVFRIEGEKQTSVWKRGTKPTKTIGT